MSVVSHKIEDLRLLSQIFTPATFSKLVRDNNVKPIEKRLRKLYLGNAPTISYKEVFQSLYQSLQQGYRSEYFYKNSIFNSFFLKQYSLTTTTVFNEFKIGNSIADFVLLNGTIRLFEIKTDLDGLEKLSKQLNDYKQFADLVYIVTSSKYIDRILDAYNDSTVGVIEFTKRNTFKEHKSAQENSQFFNHEIIFKTLRKAEYLEIVKEAFGYIPDVPNTKIFRTCLELFSEIEVSTFQKLASKKLKKRKIQNSDLLESDKTPFELKQICYSLDFSANEYNTLYNLLNNTL
jgi:hypothetical protein